MAPLGNQKSPTIWEVISLSLSIYNHKIESKETWKEERQETMKRKIKKKKLRLKKKMREEKKLIENFKDGQRCDTGWNSSVINTHAPTEVHKCMYILIIFAVGFLVESIT